MMKNTSAAQGLRRAPASESARPRGGAYPGLRDGVRGPRRYLRPSCTPGRLRLATGYAQRGVQARKQARACV